MLGQPQALAQGVARLSEAPLVGSVFDRLGLESEPGDQPADEWLWIVDLDQLFDDDAVEEAEIGNAFGDRNRTQQVDQTIEPHREHVFGPGDANGPLPLHVHDQEAGSPSVNHLGDVAGRVLEVAVHRDHCLALGGREPSHQGRLVAEIACELDQSDTAAGCHQ